MENGKLGDADIKLYEADAPTSAPKSAELGWRLLVIGRLWTFHSARFVCHMFLDVPVPALVVSGCWLGINVDVVHLAARANRFFPSPRPDTQHPKVKQSKKTRVFQIMKG